MNSFLFTVGVGGVPGEGAGLARVGFSCTAGRRSGRKMGARNLNCFHVNAPHRRTEGVEQ